MQRGGSPFSGRSREGDKCLFLVNLDMMGQRGQAVCGHTLYMSKSGVSGLCVHMHKEEADPETLPEPLG